MFQIHSDTVQFQSVRLISIIMEKKWPKHKRRKSISSVSGIDQKYLESQEMNRRVDIKTTKKAFFFLSCSKKLSDRQIVA